jgi:hypothetical protein
MQSRNMSLKPMFVLIAILIGLYLGAGVLAAPASIPSMSSNVNDGRFSFGYNTSKYDDTTYMSLHLSAQDPITWGSINFSRSSNNPSAGNIYIGLGGESGTVVPSGYVSSDFHFNGRGINLEGDSGYYHRGARGTRRKFVD